MQIPKPPSHFVIQWILNSLRQVLLPVSYKQKLDLWPEGVTSGTAEGSWKMSQKQYSPRITENSDSASLSFLLPIVCSIWGGKSGQGTGFENQECLATSWSMVRAVVTVWVPSWCHFPVFLYHEGDIMRLNFIFKPKLRLKRLKKSA